MRILKSLYVFYALLPVLSSGAQATETESFQSGYKEGGLCFYEQPEFKGKKFCAKPGEKITRITGDWNNSFSSVQLEKGITVYVCDESHFRGTCRFISQDQAKLEENLDRKISSLNVGRSGDVEKISREAEHIAKTGEDRQEAPAKQQQPRVSDRAEPDSQLAGKKEEPDKKEETTGSLDSRVGERRELADILPGDRRRENDDQSDDDDQRDRRDPRDATDGGNDRDDRKEEFSGTGNSDRAANDEIQGEVCFFELPQYRGRRFCIEADESIRILPGRWNDNVSSVNILGEARIKLCEHSDFEGECFVLEGSQPYIGSNWNDRISSVAVKFLNRKEQDRGEDAGERDTREARPSSGEREMEREEVCFYEHRGFEGRSLCVPVGDTVDRLAGGWNNTISSFRIFSTARVKVLVCDQIYLEGECTLYRNSRGFVGWIWNDRVTSIRISIDRSRDY